MVGGELEKMIELLRREFQPIGSIEVGLNRIDKPPYSYFSRSHTTKSL